MLDIKIDTVNIFSNIVLLSDHFVQDEDPTDMPKKIGKCDPIRGHLSKATIRFEDKIHSTRARAESIGAPLEA